ncbi:MAG TPA: triose-phosphate isomerase [Coleofasciculaceae cyanobacterium]|jgi:triosephosphate isomerase
MASSRRPIIAGNWKMFKTTKEAADFTQALWQKTQPHVGVQLPEIVVCPPFTALQTVQNLASQLQTPFIVAAQNMESRDNGAYTGEISPLMLLDLGVRWVILGHSERRQYYNETDETVAEKTIAALKHGMTPIVCVGEQLNERETGNTDRVIEQQVRAVLEKMNSQDLPKMVVAYEPVWAIGTGKVCDATEANRVCGLIRHFLNEVGAGDQVRIVYGGSMKPDNAQALMTQPEIDGGLVGGASLEADSFFAIIEQASLAPA